MRTTHKTKIRSDETNEETSDQINTRTPKGNPGTSCGSKGLVFNGAHKRPMTHE